MGLADAVAYQGSILRRCGDLFDQGKLEVYVAETFALAQAADAHRRLEAGGQKGKLVLTVR
jgi:NADPH2:quinone reductase